MTLDEFRAEAASWIGRPVDDFECTAWLHEPGQRPQMCPLSEADALSIPRAEFEPTDEDSGHRAPLDVRVTGDPCTLHETKVVYLLAQKILGFRGAVQPSTTGRSWNLYRDE